MSVSRLWGRSGRTAGGPVRSWKGERDARGTHIRHGKAVRKTGTGPKGAPGVKGAIFSIWMFPLPGHRFIPRIRDLKSGRFHVFYPESIPKELKCLVGGKVREQTFIDNWLDVLVCTATMRSSKVPPSRIPKRLPTRPRRHEPAIAMREIGQIDRTLSIIERALDIDMQRRSTVGLNRGEAHHALRNDLWIGRQGGIRDRTTESQHFRLACLNLLTSTIIHWNTDQLGKVVMQRKRVGLDTPEHLLRHISPLGWEHIPLIGQYIWRKMQDEIA